MANGKKLIAKNDHLELYDAGEGNGFVLNTKTGKTYPAHSLVSILAKGEWELITTGEVTNGRQG